MTRQLHQLRQLAIIINNSCVDVSNVEVWTDVLGLSLAFCNLHNFALCTTAFSHPPAHVAYPAPRACFLSKISIHQPIHSRDIIGLSYSCNHSFWRNTCNKTAGFKWISLIYEQQSKCRKTQWNRSKEFKKQTRNIHGWMEWWQIWPNTSKSFRSIKVQSYS